jgi:hypothetical protein
MNSHFTSSPLVHHGKSELKEICKYILYNDIYINNIYNSLIHIYPNICFFSFGFLYMCGESGELVK